MLSKRKLTKKMRRLKRKVGSGRRLLAFDAPQIRAFYESWEWKRVRYEALKENERRCACCGRSPEIDGVSVHVDHIKPIRRFWELRLQKSNLQILCSDCNMGKGSSDMTDWRSDRVEREADRLMEAWLRGETVR